MAGCTVGRSEQTKSEKLSFFERFLEAVDRHPDAAVTAAVAGAVSIAIGTAVFLDWLGRSIAMVPK